jgi:DNA repair protein RadC
LDTKNRLACLSQISLGTLNSSYVQPREVLKVAILANAASLILVHNHPSGDPTPSREDFDVTRRIGEAAKLLGLSLLDHLVIGEGRFYSFKDEGQIA